MMKILEESLQDVSNFLISKELKDLIVDKFPTIRKDPESVEDDVNDFVVQEILSQFDENIQPKVTQVVVIKVLGDESEIVTAQHRVVEYNGTYYDFTAHQFTEEFNNLIKFGMTPVVQSVITSDAQINDGVSTIKSYALLEYK